MSLHEIIFALDKILPKDLRFFSLRRFEETDTYGRMIQPASVWLKVLEILGPWFWRVFCRHDSRISFTKVGGDVKPKRDWVKKQLKRYKELLETNGERIREEGEKTDSILAKRTDDPRLLRSYIGRGLSRAQKPQPEGTSGNPGHSATFAVDESQLARLAYAG